MKKKNIGGRRRPPTGDDQQRPDDATVIGVLFVCACRRNTVFAFLGDKLSPVRQVLVALIQTMFLGDIVVARTMN
ncbi:hypothetical protein WN943_001444 [Citrus x changshan-huyou]